MRWVLLFAVLAIGCDRPSEISIRNDVSKPVEVIAAGVSLGSQAGSDITFEMSKWRKEGSSRRCQLPPCRGESSSSIELRFTSDSCGDVSLLVDFPQDFPVPFGSPPFTPMPKRGEPLRGTFGGFKVRSSPRDHAAVVLWVDNRNGPKRTLTIGDFTYAIEANESGPRKVAPALCELHKTARLDGAPIGELPLFSEIDPLDVGLGGRSRHWLLDTSGHRCYESELVVYSSGGGGRAPGPQRLEPAHLHELGGAVTYWFEEAPDEVKSPYGGASAFELLDVGCK